MKNGLARAAPFSLLIKTFDTQLKWNVAFFWIQRLSSFLLSILTYNKLSVKEFSILANGLAIIFLSLLWIDGGFRKAVPRYAPLFSDYKVRFFFISLLLISQVILMSVAACVALFFIYKIQTVDTFASIWNLVWCFFILFFTEGLCSALRLIYQSYMLYKKFILINAISISLEIISSAILFVCKSDILFDLIIIKIATSLFLSIVSLWYLHTLLHRNHSFDPSVQIKSACEKKILIKEFFAHAAYMWIYTILKSISERNFLLPFFTLVVGPIEANSFKIAQEIALFFHRAIVKAIATADTSLFSMIFHINHTQTIIKDAIYHVMQRTITLIGSAAFIGGVMLVIKAPISFPILASSKATLLYIMILTYLIELLAFPYERILEVNRKYRLLTLTYIPYIFTLLFFFIIFLKDSFLSSSSLVWVIMLIIMGAKLMSTLIVYIAARSFLASMAPLISPSAHEAFPLGNSSLSINKA